MTDRALLLVLQLYLVFLLADSARGFSAFQQSYCASPPSKTTTAKHLLSPIRAHLRLYAASEDGDADDVSSLVNSNNSASPVITHVPCVIKVIGVGGGGGNAVNHMIAQTKHENEENIEVVSFWAINTDAQALSKSLAEPNHRINIGRDVTRGLGAGGDPTRGAEAALENALELKRICQGADLVFITCGMGGGTGSGAAPVLAEIAKNECGCLTVGVVTKPFAFEGRRRMKQAEEAIETLRHHVDTLIVVSNEKLLQIVPENTPMTEAFLLADDILRQGVFGISEIILRPGLVNVDFADVRAVMKDAGAALMGIGTGSGKDRAADAATAAISSPLLDFPIRNAKRVVINIVGGNDLGLSEINAASEVIYKNCDVNANIIFGALVDPEMGDEVSITVLACDFTLDSPSANPPVKKLDQQIVDVPAQNGAENYKDIRTVPRRPDTIKRGFKRPVEPNKGSQSSRIRGLFRKILGD